MSTATAQTVIMGRNKTTRDAIRLLPDPEKQGRFHMPTRHIDVIDTLEGRLNERGIEIVHEDYATYRDNAMLFGIMKLRAEQDSGLVLPFAADDGTFALGLRTSTNKTMAIQLAVGLNIFVCDNMMFHGGEIALRRKNTSGVILRDVIAGGVDRYFEQQARLGEGVEWARATELTDEQAKVEIYDRFAGGIMAGSHFADVHRNYFHPSDDMTDCLPRTVWGLHNAFTREMRTLAPRARYKATLELGDMLDPARN